MHVLPTSRWFKQQRSRSSSNTLILDVRARAVEGRDMAINDQTSKRPPLPQLVIDQLVNLMEVSGEPQLWRLNLANALEQIAASDDLELLRELQGADQFEGEFIEYVGSYPGAEIDFAPAGAGLYRAALRLLECDRKKRSEVLSGFAAKLGAADE